MSSQRIDPSELEHRMWRIYRESYKDWDNAKEGTAERHQAAQTMALTAATALQAEQAK